MLLVVCLPSPCSTEAGPRPFDHLLAEFVRQRNAILLDPSATACSYHEFLRAQTETVDLAEWTSGELAVAVFEGMFDSREGREAAAVRLDSLEAAPLQMGAWVVALRLRLTTDEPEDRRRLTYALLDHPGLLTAWQSPHAEQVLAALCVAGSTDVMKERRERIAALIESLDPATDWGLATRLDRLVFLAAFSAQEAGTFRDDLQRISRFGTTRLDHLAEGDVRASVARQTAWVQRLIAQGGALLAPEEADREKLSWAELQGLMAQDQALYEWFVRYLMTLLNSAMEVGGDLRVHFALQQPRLDTVIPASRLGYERPGVTAVRAEDFVSSADGSMLRAFGGIHMTDPVGMLTCADVGMDRRAGAGFARDIRLCGEIADIHLEAVDFDGAAVTASGLRVGARVLVLPLADVSADRLARDEAEGIHLERLRLRLFGVGVASVGEHHVAAPADEGPADDEPGPGGPRGQSPTIMWLKLPSIGYQEGGISFRYANSLKFGGRYTGSVLLATTKGQPAEYQLGLNYNLLSVRNDLDLFMPATDLQEDSLGSYYFAVENREALRENHHLFQPALFVGAYTARNRLYKDPDDVSRTLDTPIAIAIEGGRPLGEGFAGRLQAAYEQARDPDLGSDSRIVLTGVFGTRPLPIERGVHLTLRGEGAARSGEDRYTWLRGTAAVTALLYPGARLSLGYYRSWENGVPRFPYDQVPEDSGLIARCDLTYAPYSFSYLNRYSQRLDRWERPQWWLGRTFGVADTFISYDQKYGRYSVGIAVNMDAIYDKIARRRFVGVEARTP